MATLDHTGFLNVGAALYRLGTGSGDARLAMKTGSSYSHYVDIATGSGMDFHYKAILSDGLLGFRIKISVVTDLFYLYGIHAILRSET